MKTENKELLDELEKNPRMEMFRKRTLLTRLSNNQYSFDASDWQRYQAISKTFHDAIMERMGNSMGS